MMIIVLKVIALRDVYVKVLPDEAFIDFMATKR